MSFWEKLQKDLNWDKFQKDLNRFQQDIKKNLEDGLNVVKDGGTAVSQRIEKITDEGKKKYKTFNLNMKVQEEFTNLGGQIYDLINKKSKNPLGSRKVVSIIKKINKLELQMTKLEAKKVKKATKKKAAKKKTTTKRKTQRKTQSS